MTLKNNFRIFTQLTVHTKTKILKFFFKNEIKEICRNMEDFKEWILVQLNIPLKNAIDFCTFSWHLDCNVQTNYQNISWTRRRVWKVSLTSILHLQHQKRIISNVFPLTTSHAGSTERRSELQSGKRSKPMGWRWQPRSPRCNSYRAVRLGSARSKSSSTAC